MVTKGNKYKVLNEKHEGKSPFIMAMHRAVPWLRLLVAGLSPWRPGSIHVGFAVDKVALGQVFL
jgi:hypothetical protein